MGRLEDARGDRGDLWHRAGGRAALSPEGARVLLANRDALSRIADVEERAAEYERLVSLAYDRGSALNAASVFGVDDVIDPAETRRWIVKGLESVPHPEPLRRGRRTFLDTW